MMKYKGVLRNRAEILYAAFNPNISPIYPDFLCIGAPRTGTTWLYETLYSHPDIFIARRKELHFFDEPIIRKWQGKQQDINKRLTGKYYDMENASHWRWYSMQFQGANDRIKGEITPAYSRLSDDRVQLLAQRLGNVRIIYMMRNPVERAWSSVKFFSWQFTEKILSKADHNRTLEFVMHPRRLMGGNYEDVITRWERFISQENILFLFYDDLAADPSSQLQRICDFLGVKAHPKSRQVLTAKRVNYSAQHFDIPRDIERLLHDYYDGQIDYLENRFMRDLSHWRAKTGHVSD